MHEFVDEKDNELPKNEFQEDVLGSCYVLETPSNIWATFGSV